MGKKNGDELIEHFMAKATISVDYINQQQQMWNEFLDYFGCGDSVDNISEEEELEPEVPLSSFASLGTSLGTSQISEVEEVKKPVQVAR